MAKKEFGSFGGFDLHKMPTSLKLGSSKDGSEEEEEAEEPKSEKKKKKKKRKAEEAVAEEEAAPEEEPKKKKKKKKAEAAEEEVTCMVESWAVANRWGMGRARDRNMLLCLVCVLVLRTISMTIRHGSVLHLYTVPHAHPSCTHNAQPVPACTAYGSPSHCTSACLATCV